MQEQKLVEGCLHGTLVMTGVCEVYAATPGWSVLGNRCDDGWEGPEVHYMLQDCQMTARQSSTVSVLSLNVSGAAGPGHAGA